ncbi:MAG: phosphoribosylanthranilate isomerase [Acetobacteraceae bacterium]|nr:phosphoribosylanthranilate isomerase [Acetobacteraceae bacterium]
MTKVKICGVNAPDALAAAAAAGADWVGFVFFPPSPRALSPAQAASLSATHPGGPARVGLFVDPEDDDVAAVLAALRLDALQLHGVGAERAQAIRNRFGLPVWHAIGVESRADLPQTSTGVDWLLLDAKAPIDAELPGGNAQSFDWSVLRGWTAPAPWLLAGGLTPENVRQAVETSGAPAVDVSSGVERGRGIKDGALIRAFVAAAKGT